MRTRARRNATAALFGVLAVAGAGCAVQPAATREAATIPAEELRSYPPILVRWGEAQHATHTATGDVYVVQPDGSGVRRLLSWPDRIKDRQVYGAGAAAWSPNRRQVGLLLGWWCGDPCFTLARVAAAGGPVTKLKVPADLSFAVWSPDWRALLTTFGGRDLWTIPMSGGKALRIWHSPAGTTLSDSDWSPNGGQIVVSTSRGLVRMTRAGKQLVRVTRVGGDGEPRWPPNGREIAFVRQPRCFWEPDCAAPAHLYLVRPDGRGLRRVWSGPNAFTLLWSPDSRSILFTADRSTEDATRLEIELVRADSRGRRTLSSGGVATAEAWSRDGRKILFARDQTPQQGGSDLWVMDADGERPTRLLSRPGWTVLSADWGA